MKEEATFSTVLIELDALMDTRMATVSTFGDEAIETVLLDHYHERLIDRFKGIDEAAFRSRYEQRDRGILFGSMITPMGNLLAEFAQKTLKNAISTPFKYRPKILINIHPYQLAPEEIKIILAAVIVKTQQLADVEIVNWSYDEITPAYVKDQLSILILYEYYRWLELHSANENFKKTSCPEVTLLGPAIRFVSGNLPKDDSSSVEVFEAIQELAGPFIGLQLLPIEHFSLVLKPKKQAESP